MKSDPSSIRRNEDVSVGRLTRSGDIRPLDQIAAAEKHAHLRIIGSWQVENSSISRRKCKTLGIIGKTSGICGIVVEATGSVGFSRRGDRAAAVRKRIPPRPVSNRARTDASAKANATDEERHENVGITGETWGFWMGCRATGARWLERAPKSCRRWLR